MSNDFGATNGRLLGQKILGNLKTLPVLANISCNFGAILPGGARANFGQEVSVPLVTAVAAADYDRAAGGYVASDSTDTNASVTVDQHKHVTREITVEEAFTFGENVLDRQAELDANTIGNAMVQALTGLVKNNAIPTATQQTVKAVGSFDSSAVIDINTALDDRDVTDVGRFGVLNSSYHGALRKDPSVVSANINPGSTAVQSGKITTVDGVDFIKFPGLPGNSENLTGFVSAQDGLAIATIIPALDKLAGFADIPKDAYIEVITEPESGLQILLVEKMDSDLGVVTRSYRIMFGVGIGNALNVQKIASA